MVLVLAHFPNVWKTAILKTAVEKQGERNSEFVSITLENPVLDQIMTTTGGTDFSQLFEGIKLIDTKLGRRERRLEGKDITCMNI